MENLNYDGLNAKEFKRIQGQVMVCTKALYKNNAIAMDIANRVLLAVSMEEMLPVELEAKINSEIAKESEAYFSDLWMYCFRYALKLTDNNELAQDVAQDAIITLFQKEHQVEFIKGWLKRVVFNLAKTELRFHQRQKNLPKMSLDKIVKTEPMQDETQLTKYLTLAQAKKYLNEDDYALFVKLKAAKNMRRYAYENGISYQTAREHSHKMMHNLKQNYLKQHGWKNSQQILSFRQISNLKRFFKVLAEHAEQGSLDQLSRYCPKSKVKDVQATLANLKEVSDWGVRMLDEALFHVFVADCSGGEIPAMYILHIHMNKANSIKIAHAEEAPLMGVIDKEHVDQMPLDKGKVAFSIEEIKALIAKSSI